jgi:hypothetical protein
MENEKAVLVEVRPIEVKKWHNKSGVESFTRPKKLQALVDGTTMRYATGLSPADIKSLKAKGINYDLTDNFSADNSHPFWDSPLAVIKLENHTMFFNPENALDFIKIKIMKASRFVANSMEEYNEGHFPDATHVIFDEVEQATILSTKVEAKNEAVLLSSNLSPDKKIQIILVMGGKNLKNQSPNFITIEIDKLITKDPVEFIRHAKMDNKQLANHALVLEALQRNILREEGNRIYHMDSPIGLDVIEVAEFLTKDENQDIKLLILKKLNS